MTCNRYYSIFLSHLHDINAKLNQLTARVYDNGRNAWQETADVRVISWKLEAFMQKLMTWQADLQLFPTVFGEINISVTRCVYYTTLVLYT